MKNEIKMPAKKRKSKAVANDTAKTAKTPEEIAGQAPQQTPQQAPPGTIQVDPEAIYPVQGKTVIAAIGRIKTMEDFFNQQIEDIRQEVLQPLKGLR